MIQKKKEAMMNVPIFLTHFSSKEYTPYPEKYLNNKYWEDEEFQQPKEKNQNGDLQEWQKSQANNLKDYTFEP